MGYIDRYNNFKNLLAVYNAAAVSFASEPRAVNRLLFCNLSKFWQMINLKLSFNPASILFIADCFRTFGYAFRLLYRTCLS
jgi:hypothetical protein